MRLGVLGGTFDPIHLGHLIVAEHARTRLELEKVLLIPSGQPYLKEGNKVTEAHHRLAMVKLAAISNPYLEVSSMEIDRPGSTYTIDTLKALHKEMPKPLDIFFIMGMDLLKEMSRWRHPERILDLCTVVAVERPGFTESGLDPIAEGSARRVLRMEGPFIDISATGLREDVARGVSIKYRVPLEVEEYIQANGLYRGRGSQS